jgi:tRNA1(Val) A37 N6-methylase TrmN6
MTDADMRGRLEPPFTTDMFLGEKLTVRQPASGYRAGVDAVLLAASVVITPGTSCRILDAGAGAGTVGLCIAARLASAEIVLFEREAALAGMAAANIISNNFAHRMRAVEGDVAINAQDLAALGLQQESFDWVVANPPFHIAGSGTLAGDPLKARTLCRAMRSNCGPASWRE